MRDTDPGLVQSQTPAVFTLWIFDKVNDGSISSKSARMKVRLSSPIWYLLAKREDVASWRSYKLLSIFRSRMFGRLPAACTQVGGMRGCAASKINFRSPSPPPWRLWTHRQVRKISPQCNASSAIFLGLRSDHFHWQGSQYSHQSNKREAARLRIAWEVRSPFLD
jgi:hypothetical protein